MHDDCPSLEDFEITALGRCAEPPLMEAALVSVWETQSQECLASALVGPTSRVDGFYAWEPLMEPLLLKKGQEYRLSQSLGIPASVAVEFLERGILRH